MLVDSNHTKIVILDGDTLNPGDLSWQGFAALGDLRCFERTTPAQLFERAMDADVVLTNKTLIDAKTIKALTRLKYIGILATGTNVVDIDAASSQGIVVTNVPNYGADAVAQMVFAHILHHTQKVAEHSQAVKQGQWSQSKDFCFTLSALQSLKDKVFGVIGYGAIGRQVADIAAAFQMRVIVTGRRRKQNLAAGIQWCSLNELYQQADIISLHCPLTQESERMINAGTLSSMKSSAILINTARGGLVDESALLNALNNGTIAGAGLDVLTTEPPAGNHPLFGAKNISISPHNAWATRDARQNLLNIALNNLNAFIEGEPINQVYSYTP